MPLHCPDPIPDIRLIACDLDGTLLDDEHAIHDEFWPLARQLHSLGITFCPASGRQYYNLRAHFAPIAEHAVFIAENGSYVVRGEVEIKADCLGRSDVVELIATTRELRARGADIGAVLCGKRSAYIERICPEFRAEAARYNQRLTIVDDLLAVDDDMLKLATYDFDASKTMTTAAFAPYRDRLQVVGSARHWLDVRAPQANKGAALRRVQETLGITREQTMAFGDFLNDLELMDAAAYSFAMDNAHPQLKARSRFLAPGNTENGVVRTIKSVLGIA